MCMQLKARNLEVSEVVADEKSERMSEMIEGRGQVYRGREQARFDSGDFREGPDTEMTHVWSVGQG